MGQSTAIGMGGDPVVGLYFRDLLGMLQNDPQTDAIVMIGEIGVTQKSWPQHTFVNM